MEPTISIPPGWQYPRYTFGQRTQHGTIIGMRYYAADTFLGQEYGEGWRYILLPDKNHEDEEHRELKTQIQAEIDYYSSQLEQLKSEIKAIPITVTVATTQSEEQDKIFIQQQKKSWDSALTLQSFIDAAQLILKEITKHPDYIALDYQPDLTVGDAQTALSYLNDELETNQQSDTTAN
jgi:hypothetical protein